MDRSLMNVGDWDRLSEAEARRIAQVLSIPGFDLLRVASCAQGGVSRHVAFFGHADGAEFALLPGGKVTLGLDPKRAPALDAAGQESWAASMEQYHFPPFVEHLGQVMLPEREVTVAPMLVETGTRGVAEVIDEYDHAALVAALGRDGFRLLGSDEWEYACAAGTRTLWRWGDSCPTGEQPYGDVHFADLRRPNAFGLSITQNPYDWEYVAEAGKMRGGDGGDAICGTYGHVAAWLPCASPYVWPMFEADSYLDEGFVRRALPLG